MPISWDIRGVMSGLIGAMQPPTYHYNWSVNGFSDHEKTINADIIGVEEANLEAQLDRGSSSQQYLNSMIFDIQCSWKKEDLTEEDPNLIAAKMDSDLKRLFGINHSDSATWATFLYMGHVIKYAQNVIVPIGILWRVRVNYRQLRINPEVPT